MSYDVYLEAMREVDVFWQNYTSNCAPMWEAAGVDLPALTGTSAADAIPCLRDAVAAMEADPERFRAMNPENGWGRYESALEFLRSIRDACVENPDGRIRVSY